MKGNKFLIIDKKILPDYYDKVIETRNLIRSGKIKDVSEAVKITGISRSTYYKYKDYIFEMKNDDTNRKAIITFNLSHKTGILGEVLRILSEFGANILTITQNPPINENAHVVLSIDISSLSIEINELLEIVNKVDGVTDTNLITLE